MVDKTLKDVYESDPLALASAYGVEVVDPEETVEAAKDAAQFTWESLPGVGTYYTVEDIKNELRQEKPNYLKIGALAGTEVIGLVPGLGGAAKNMIRKGATFKKKPDVVDVESNIPKVSREVKPSYTDAELLDADNDIFEWEKGNLSNPELRKRLSDKGFEIQTKMISPKMTGDDLEVVGPDGNIVRWKDMPRGTDMKPQMSNEEYDSLFLTLDEADTPEEWQKKAKALIEERRVSNPSIKTPELEDSARQLLENKITREQHLANVDKYKPVNPWDALPRDPSDKALVFALDSNKRRDGLFVLDDATAETLGVQNSTLSVGMKFNGRLDIPAYTNNDTWIVAGTSPAVKSAEGKGVTTYAKAIHYVADGDKPVKFLASEKMSAKIGTGEANKTGYATVSGIVGDLDVDAIRTKAAQYLNDPEWTQVGFDPRRQGGFYVRAGDNKHVPVREATEVIQIGPLVLAKNAKLDMEYEGYSEGGAVMDEQMNAVFKSSRTGMAVGGTVDLDTVPDNTIGVDPVSGNEIPLGSTPENVRDDIPAQLSEGEYVVPADVVRYYGVKFFEDLRADAKFGYQDMQENGRIGGDPVGMEMGQDELPFDISELQVIDEPVEMNEGGLAPSTYGGTMYGGGGVEYIEYTDGTRTMLIPFFNGVPMAVIPEGFYAGSSKTATAEEAAATPSGSDDGGPDMDAPEPIDYANLTTDELAEMVEQQTTFGMEDGVSALLGALNPLAGLFMRGAMMHQAKLTKKELERRVESEDISDEERARLQSLIEITEQPNFMQGILGKIKGAFDKEETKEPEIPTIDKQSVTDAVTEAMMYDPTAKSVLEDSNITTSELAPIVTPTNKAGEMPEPYRPKIDGPNVAAMRKQYLGDENTQPDVDFSDPTLVPSEPDDNDPNTTALRMRRAGERAGETASALARSSAYREAADRTGSSISDMGSTVAPSDNDDDPTNTGGQGDVGLGSGAGGMNKGGLASRKKKK